VVDICKPAWGGLQEKLFQPAGEQSRAFTPSCRSASAGRQLSEFGTFVSGIGLPRIVTLHTYRFRRSDKAAL